MFLYIIITLFISFIKQNKNSPGSTQNEIIMNKIIAFW